ncbi:uncharacterized protein FTOL_01363 [Fusarium torulosum]|uniref:F-box domain-containing protein n=1 Tax=Fusarium torulosum TaxID=33205 RepID=A0AAE8M023_9HYPO|nr:uncharacterized protein FTOL_01363 [Fusarium torulosum]
MYQQAITFQGLPFDIHVEVAKHLNYQELLILKATNRYFHTVLNPKSILGVQHIIDCIIERDDYLRKIGHELFGCSNCFKFLPKKKFGKHDHFYSITCSFRSCLDCTATLKPRRHLESISSADSSLRYYFCHNCGQCRTKSEKCRGKRIESGFKEEEVAEALSLCAQPRRQRQGLEKLPAQILKKMSSFLGFLDVLRLAQVSRDLNDVVKPNQWVVLHTRYRFVHDKWAKEVQNVTWLHIKTVPCYMCCQILPKDKFTPKQIKLCSEQPETSWKMRCKACVWLMGRSAMSIKRIEHRRREMCETCGCIKYARTTCGGCMELYVRGSIDRKTLYPNEGKQDKNLSLIGNMFDSKGEMWDEKMN